MRFSNMLYINKHGNILYCTCDFKANWWTKTRRIEVARALHNVGSYLDDNGQNKGWFIMLTGLLVLDHLFDALTRMYAAKLAYKQMYPAK